MPMTEMSAGTTGIWETNTQEGGELGLVTVRRPEKAGDPTG